jgi:hypothetical protein
MLLEFSFNATNQTTNKFEDTGSNHRCLMECSSPPTTQPRYFPRDFHLFGALKDAINGKKFGSDDGVIEEVKKWLRVQNSNWH